MADVTMVDLVGQYREIQKDLDAAYRRVMERGSFVLGEEVAAFEREFAAHAGARHAVAVATGTDALQLVLRALGIGPGDEVITVANTAIATAVAVTYAGARPVFVDVDPDTLLMDIDAARRAITPRTKALLPVHLFGNAFDARAFRELADARGLHLVEDACQAHGASHAGSRVGTVGAAGCFSFYPTKNLGAFGDAGAVVTDDGTMAERLRLLRNYGQTRAYEHATIGYNSRLDELQAAFLRAKLPHLDAWNARRRENAARYDALLGESIDAPRANAGAHHVYHQYVVRHRRRDALRDALAAAGVATQIHYPTPIHRSPAYAPTCEGITLPVVERAAAEIVSLPVHPQLTREDVERVAREVARAARSLA